MSVTIFAGTRLLETGDISDVTRVRVSRSATVDIAGARGAGREELGTVANELVIEGALSGTRTEQIDDFNQFDRYRMLGNSLKCYNPYQNTCVFIDTVAPTGYYANALVYQLRLIESLFRQINNCDDLVNWDCDPTCVLTNEYQNPDSPEGEYHIQCAGDGDDAGNLNFTYTPADPIDFTPCTYLAFWFRVSDLTNIDEINAHLYDGATTASCNFEAYITEAAKFFRVILHKSEFSNYLILDWSAITSIIFELIYTAPVADVEVLVDDIGGYE